MDCLFCNISEERVIAQNDLAYAVRGGFPVTPLHTLIIPKSHAIDYFALTPSELLGCDQLIKKLSADIKREDPTVDGFNIGLNAGESAGRKSMGLVIFTGLSIGTLFTLFVVPAMYLFIGADHHHQQHSDSESVT